MVVTMFVSAIAPISLTSSFPSLSNSSAAAIANVVSAALITIAALLFLLYLIEIISRARQSGDRIIAALYVFVLPLTIVFIACTAYRAINLYV